MKAVVWSRDMCAHCEQAKSLLKMKGIEFEEKKVGHGYTKEDLLEAVPSKSSTTDFSRWRTSRWIL